MKAPAPTRRDRLRAMLADLKMPGALEAVDGILSEADSGTLSAAEAIEQLLNAQTHSSTEFDTPSTALGGTTEPSKWEIFDRKKWEVFSHN